MAETLSHEGGGREEVFPETEVGVFLKELLAYDNPRLSKYQGLIERERVASKVYLPQQFSRHWEEFNDNPEMRSFFSDKLRGGILVDIGGGQGRVVRNLAKKSGVAKIINVDVMGEDDMDVFRGKKVEDSISAEVIDVHADMLDFVSRLPDGSCNFSINGIDINVIEDSGYREALFHELVRATRIGGIMFGAGSDIWRKDGRLNLIPPEKYGGAPDLFETSLEQEAVFEKVSEK